MWFWLSLIALLCWSGSDLFSKIGCQGEDDHLAHLKMVIAVGTVMGLHAAFEIFIGGTASFPHRTVCAVCGGEYGELDPKNHTNLKHFPAKAATKTTEGNIEYWYCSGCKKYYKDATATQEITKAQTVTAKLPGGTVKPGADKSPQTGDNPNLLLWIALLFVSGGAAIGTTVVSKKRKYNK